ncbi:hypothetical protein BO221_49305 [Archangium sp. Cb G35]|nr:hypothetical protein BO221_49305 [Archangium sp. Cb G35]
MRIFTLSPLRLTKTKRCPEYTSSPQAVRTRAMSPSMELRMSTGGVANNVLSVMLRRSANSLCVSPLASYSSATRTHSGFSLCFDMPSRVRRLPQPGQAPQHVIGRTDTFVEHPSMGLPARPAPPPPCFRC